MKLNEVLAHEKVIKGASDAALTTADKTLQKAALFAGMSKTYRPATENPEGDAHQFPPEEKPVEAKVTDLLLTIQQNLSDLIDITRAKDETNCVAKASVTVNGAVLLENVPVTHLLWLEKQLSLLKGMLEKIPVLSTSEHWEWDESHSLYATPPTDRARTEKTTKPIVVVPATDKHPAQVHMATEDKTVGYWTHRSYSGAVKESTRLAILGRLDKVLAAVKSARALANCAEAVLPDRCAALTKYIFG